MILHQIYKRSLWRGSQDDPKMCDGIFRCQQGRNCRCYSTGSVIQTAEDITTDTAQQSQSNQLTSTQATTTRIRQPVGSDSPRQPLGSHLNTGAQPTEFRGK